MIDFIAQLDADLLLFFNSLRHPIFDYIVKDFSGRGVWIPLYISIAAVMVRCYGWRRGLLYVLLVAALVGLADFVTASVLRPWFQRLRPSHPDNPLSEFVQLVDGYRSGRYGFPSCHGANTFALAVASSVLIRTRPYIVFIFAWALCQCYSRMYLGVHYPGDLIVGAIVGSACGCLALVVIRYADKNRPDIQQKPTVAYPVIAVGVATVVYLIIKEVIRSL